MAKQRDDGVASYTKVVVDLYCPEDHVCCDLCPLMETYARKQCRRTGEYLLDTRYRGLWCPLKIEEKTEEIKNETF